MHQLINLSHEEKGDTIVEVLLATAIISLVLVVAYSITSKNTLNLQNNAERVQAQHLVEGQIEALKANDGLVGGTCFKDGSPASGTDCQPDDVAGSGADYQLKVTPTATADTYAVSATWTSLDSNTPSDVTMYYRLK